MTDVFERHQAMVDDWASKGHPESRCVGHEYPLPLCPAPDVHKAFRRARELEIGAAQAQEVRLVLRNLLVGLESVQAQRKASTGRPGQRMTVPVVRAQGEVLGLQIAIDAVKRRLR